MTITKSDSRNGVAFFVLEGFEAKCYLWNIHQFSKPNEVHPIFTFTAIARGLQ